ncbi:pre-mRNA splicing factor prp17 [Culex quinquefasciatus]|uniref:Pre-mRNA splicing factor prp17 n=1 Tax=Culex quinquefasciatus TaxID=7176 RepID=B0XI78_CULQU|nr:pre-mRNA splicing factor prp17 [Culex quinquefasciatus]|eukprot:XP_001869350.1 pre-mRNA splicing factor prp17 [Culex quinquefasciatus]
MSRRGHATSFLHPPHDVGVKSGAPDRCLLPHHIHTWTGHSQGISGIWRFLNLALLLSCSPDQDLGGLQRAAWLANLLGPPAGRAEHTRSGYIVQEYDRHLGAVNTITFVNQNRRIVTTSDDKSLRVLEWGIPVDFMYHFPEWQTYSKRRGSGTEE